MKVALISALSVLGITGVASASSFANITTVIRDTIPIFGSLVDLVIAIAPVMIAFALIGFVIGMFSTMLDTISGRMARL